MFHNTLQEHVRHAGLLICINETNLLHKTSNHSSVALRSPPFLRFSSGLENQESCLFVNKQCGVLQGEYVIRNIAATSPPFWGLTCSRRTDKQANWMEITLTNCAHLVPVKAYEHEKQQMIADVETGKHPRFLPDWEQQKHKTTGAEQTAKYYFWAVWAFVQQQSRLFQMWLQWSAPTSTLLPELNTYWPGLSVLILSLVFRRAIERWFEKHKSCNDLTVMMQLCLCRSVCFYFISVRDSELEIASKGQWTVMWFV